MFDPFRRTVSIDPLRSIDDLEQRVQQLGFFPMFSCGIRGFSVYENTPQFWTNDVDGPWEWKGPLIRMGNCGYGKFFNHKAGYVSLEWLPDSKPFVQSSATSRSSAIASTPCMTTSPIHIPILVNVNTVITNDQ